jgi:phosphoribosylglycinamide formyltransferase-1
LKRIAIFASGRGSNAKRIIEYFKASKVAEVVLIITNNADSGAIDVAREHNIACFYFSNELLEDGQELLERLKDFNIDFIVLAGFIRKIPRTIIEAYPKQIVNIHPALLPKFGGKGMYGLHVHQAVLAAGEKETGITIHLVNEKYDDGQIIAQYTLPIPKNITAKHLQQLVQELEHQHYPLEIEKYIEHV